LIISISQSAFPEEQEANGKGNDQENPNEKAKEEEERGGEGERGGGGEGEGEGGDKETRAEAKEEGKGREREKSKEKEEEEEEEEAKGFPPVPYKPPSWASPCQHEYFFEVLKNGTIVGEVDLTSKSQFLVGRLPNCDISLENPVFIPLLSFEINNSIYQ